MGDKFEISRDLLERILNFFFVEIEEYTGARRNDFADDATIHKIYEGLEKEFGEYILTPEDQDDIQDLISCFAAGGDASKKAEQIRKKWSR